MKRLDRKILVIIVCICIFASSLCVYGDTSSDLSEEKITERENESVAKGNEELKVITRPSENVEWPVLENEPYGKAAILLEPDTGAVLYSKNPDEKLYPASITKIMTGLLAVENLNLSDTITITSEMVDSLPSDAARQGIAAGEVITVKDCLYSLLLRSNNDMAVALAFAVAGSEKAFAEMMTERAESVGAVNTHFANASGLHDDNHYTTARDMALIAREAMSNPTFAQIWGTDEYSMSATNMEDAFDIWNRHDMLVSGRTYYYQYAIGGKTGYTDEAGRTLVTCASKDGMKLIAVILYSTNEDAYEDTRDLFDFGFNNFKKITISGNEQRFGQNVQSGYSIVNTIYGSKGDLFTMGSGSVVIPKDAQLSQIGYSLDMSIEDTGKGEVAKVTYLNGEEELGEAVIYMSASLSDDKSSVSSLEKKLEDTEKTDVNTVFSINVYYIAAGVAGLVVLVLVVRVCVKINRRRRIGRRYYKK